MAVELARLIALNVGFFVVGAAAFAAGGWLAPGDPATWPRLGAAYLFGIVVVVVPTSYLVLLSVPVGIGAAAVAALVVAATVWRVGLRPRVGRPGLPRPSVGGLCAVGLFGITLLLLIHALPTFTTRPLVNNDAWAVWTARARLLYQDPGPAAGALRTGQYGPTPYPLAIPTLEALGFTAMGRFDATLIDTQLLFLLAGFVGALWAILRRHASAVAVALCALAIVAAPELLYQLITQYVDVPLGLFVGLGVAAAAAWTSRPEEDGWLLGCAVAFLAMAGSTKSEGFMFVVAAGIALVVAQLGPAWRRRLPPVLVALAALAACLAPWRIYCAAYGLSSSDYDLADVADPHYLREHAGRFRPVVHELAVQLASTRNWGFLAAAIVAGLVTGLAARRFRATAFAAVWLGLGLLGLILIYWVSRLPTSYNLSNSGFRTIVSLLVGGAAMIPILISPAERLRSG